MKKTFKLTHPKIKYDRLVEAVRAEINKYLKRERNKELPKGVDFWDFDCKFGFTEDEAKVIHLAEIPKAIDEAAGKELASFYVEILAKSGVRTKKPKSEITETEIETESDVDADVDNPEMDESGVDEE